MTKSSVNPVSNPSADNSRFSEQGSRLYPACFILINFENNPFHRGVFFFFAFAFFCLAPFLIFAGSPEPSSYLERLVERSSELRLYEKRYWKILVDYESHWGGRIESRQDGPGYFLADNGKTDPEAELEATLRSFFQPVDFILEHSKLHPRCQFVARFAWLSAQLGLDLEQMPTVVCDSFLEWKQELSVNRVTLIFPGADIKIPASMFGHTLIRIDNTERKGGDLLNYAINFAAAVDISQANVITYSVLGVFGGYDGYFSLVPYHYKVQEYSEVEQRDIWEYELNLNPEEIDRLMAKLWESRFASYDYFFFRENCSFLLLGLLEAAKPELDLSSRFPVWTVPIDTVRLLNQYPGMIRSVKYRPSRLNKLNRDLEALEENENRWFEKILSQPEEKNSAAFQELDEQSKAGILDAVADAYLVRNEPKERKIWMDTLRQRARIAYRTPDKPITYKRGENPLNIHKTSKFSLFAGQSDFDSESGQATMENNRFLGLTFRPAYRDHLDSSVGLGRNVYYTLEFFTTTLRANRPDRWFLDSLTMIQIENLNPSTAIESLLSYKLGVKLVRAKQAGCYSCLGSRLIGLFGMAKEFSGVNAYLLGGGVWNQNNGAAYPPAVELVAKAGLLHYGAQFNFRIETDYHRLPSVEGKDYQGFSAGFSYHGFENSELRAQWEKTNRHSEARLGWGYYF